MECEYPAQVFSYFFIFDIAGFQVCSINLLSFPSIALAQVDYLQKALQDAQNENQKMSSTLESVMASHTQLQSAMEKLQTELGKRDSEVDILNEERYLSSPS